MKSITDYLISAGRKVSQNTVSDYVEALTERAGKKSQYVRERIVLTLPVSDRQGIFCPFSEQKTLKKDKKSVKIRTISLRIKNTNKSIQTGNNNHRRIPLFFTSEKPKMFF